mmetsp:Transcript_68748/g.149633  ORF Transcript_68748/g.149633 Transcript_68748/m.149633 type:complete len:204 (+) Transcript_68748:683-1294(+)
MMVWHREVQMLNAAADKVVAVVALPWHPRFHEKVRSHQELDVILLQEGKETPCLKAGVGVGVRRGVFLADRVAGQCRVGTGRLIASVLGNIIQVAQVRRFRKTSTTFRGGDQSLSLIVSLSLVIKYGSEGLWVGVAHCCQRVCTDQEKAGDNPRGIVDARQGLVVLAKPSAVLISLASRQPAMIPSKFQAMPAILHLECTLRL